MNTNTNTNTNIIGPISKRINDNNWDEFIHTDSKYYYLKKNKYHCVTSPPAPRRGWEWIEISGNNYIVKIEDENFPYSFDENNKLVQYIYDITLDATQENFDVDVNIDFTQIQSYNEIFELLTKDHTKLFLLLNFLINNLQNKFNLGKIDEKEFLTLCEEFFQKIKINFDDPQFEIMKYITNMLREKVNFVGPVEYLIPINNKWDEFENKGLYYYFRRGFYKKVEKDYISENGSDLFTIGENKYIVYSL
jgi:hypothetical protein